MPGDGERQRAIRPLRLERVAKDFFGQARFTEDQGQRVLEGVTGRALEPEAVLIDLALGDDVLVEEVVEGEAAAEIVAMPADFAFDPWAVFGIAVDGEVDALVIPCRAAFGEESRRQGAVFGDEAGGGETGGQIPVEKTQGLRLTGIEGEWFDDDEGALRPGSGEVILNRIQPAAG